MEQIDVLILAYEFPPLNRGGTQRPMRFFKNLITYQIKAHILTVDPESYSGVFEDSHNNERAKDVVSSHGSITYIPSKALIKKNVSKLRQFIAIYFNYYGREAEAWKPYFFNAAEICIKKYQPKLIMVTAPPFSIISLGVILSQKHRIPLLLDMRDAWSQWVIGPYGSYVHYLLTLNEERKALKKAHSIVCTSDATMADYKRMHPMVESSKFSLISNSYDEDISDWSTVNQKLKGNSFVIGYVGSFYYNPTIHKKMFSPWWKKRGHHLLEYTPRKEDWLYRSPYYFFKSIRLLLSDYPSLKDVIKIRFVGKRFDWLEDMVQEFNLNSIVELLGVYDLNNSREFQKNCDALLITSSKVLGADDYSIAGKTFEYISAKRPIISFVSNGSQKRLMQESGLSVMCDPDDSKDSAEQMRKLILGQTKFCPNIEFLESLSSKRTTKKLASVMKSAIRSFEMKRVDANS